MRFKNTETVVTKVVTWNSSVIFTVFFKFAQSGKIISLISFSQYINVECIDIHKKQHFNPCSQELAGINSYTNISAPKWIDFFDIF